MTIKVFKVFQPYDIKKNIYQYFSDNKHRVYFNISFELINDILIEQCKCKKTIKLFSLLDLCMYEDQ